MVECSVFWGKTCGENWIFIRRFWECGRILSFKNGYKIDLFPWSICGVNIGFLGEKWFWLGSSLIKQCVFWPYSSLTIYKTMIIFLFLFSVQVNQWVAIQSRVQFVWQSQHHWKLHLVHSICIQPPSRSVGVRHLGQGLVMTRIVNKDELSNFFSCHRACKIISGFKVMLDSCLSNSGRAASQSSFIWNPWWQFLQKTYWHWTHLTLRSSGSSGIIPAPHRGWGQRTPPAWSRHSSAANRWYL